MATSSERIAMTTAYTPRPTFPLRIERNGVTAIIDTPRTLLELAVWESAKRQPAPLTQGKHLQVQVECLLGILAAIIPHLGLAGSEVLELTPLISSGWEVEQ
jgi:hypothetical protein